MMDHHTEDSSMRTAKIAVTIDENVLSELDELVAAKVFPNRSRAVQEAVRDKLERLRRSRLARECAKLDPAAEQALAEEGLSEDAEQWPAY
jgi:Arc/MetJ-type ribon-helix-helix transcriptional regulator